MILISLPLLLNLSQPSLFCLGSFDTSLFRLSFIERFNLGSLPLSFNGFDFLTFDTFESFDLIDLSLFASLDFTLPGILAARSAELGGQPVTVPDLRRGCFAGTEFWNHVSLPDGEPEGSDYTSDARVTH